MQVFCDFDGTITLEDTSGLVLSQLADPQWEVVEVRWERGEIGSGQCMQEQVAMIRASPSQLNALLDQVDIDPGFGDLVAFCRESDWPLTIVSDGVDYFINRVLMQHGFADLPVKTNQCVVSNDNRYSLSSIYSVEGCESNAGVCKCGIVTASPGPRIYIGDGRSDFCVADKNDLIFAKGRLALYCEKNGIDFVPYVTLHDVTRALQKLIVDQSRLTASP